MVMSKQQAAIRIFLILIIALQFPSVSGQRGVLYCRACALDSF
jgi:hypothetical protein